MRRPSIPRGVGGKAFGTPVRVASFRPVRIGRGEDSRLALRPWNGEDAAGFQGWLTREGATMYDQAHVRRCIAQAGSSDALVLTIDGSGDDQPVGTVTLYTSSELHWSVGYWVSAPWRGRGIATAALMAATHWAFRSHPPLLRISLFARPDNVASHRVAERAGYRREGILRRWLESDGTLKDVLMFSSVRDDHVAS